MGQVNGNDPDMLVSRGEGLPPSFDPRCAFAWTLRSAEIARRSREGTVGRPHGTNPRGASNRTTFARA